jgi:GNAT superfamily N-acetyltransferase
MTTTELIAPEDRLDGDADDAPGHATGGLPYLLERLGPAAGERYQELTFPAYRPLLARLGTDPSIVAVGATRFDRPVGLALAQRPQGWNAAAVLSVYVRPGYRRAGLGTDLLAALEGQLQASGCQWAYATYLSDSPGIEAFEAVLRRREWAAPVCRLVIHRGTAASMESAPWLSRYRLPPELTIFPWRDLTPEDRQAILDRQARRPWYSEELSPFFEEENIEYMNSLGLRHQGQVIGWMITHRTGPHTVRYSRLHIDADPRFRGRSPCLLAASIKLHMAYATLRGMRDRLEAVWAISPANPPMMRFAERRLKPYLSSTAESRGSWKQLGGQALESPGGERP